MELQLLVAGGLVMMTSLVGVIFTHKVAATFLEERLSYLVSFAAGVFLVTAGAVTFEVFETTSWWQAVLFIVLGYGLAWGLEILIPESHQHHDPECDHEHQHSAKRSARKLIVGDSVHNVADGIMLVPAFVVSPALGFAVTLGIIIHETLQEISEFFVLRQSGMSTKRALLVNFLVSSTVFVGIAIAYYTLAFHELETLLLAISAGFFLHIVAHDLVPRRHDHETASQFGLHVVMLLIGLSLMAGVNLLLRDSHVHGDHDHEEHAGEEHDHHE